MMIEYDTLWEQDRGVYGLNSGVSSRTGGGVEHIVMLQFLCSSVSNAPITLGCSGTCQ